MTLQCTNSTMGQEHFPVETGCSGTNYELSFLRYCCFFGTQPTVFPSSPAEQGSYFSTIPVPQWASSAISSLWTSFRAMTWTLAHSSPGTVLERIPFVSYYWVYCLCFFVSYVFFLKTFLTYIFILELIYSLIFCALGN